MEKLETLWGGYTLAVGPAFPLSTDTMCLAAFTPVPPRCKAVDLGSGSGALGLLLCGKRPDCTVTGIELSPAAHEAALENIRRNQLENRLESRLGDIREIRGLLPAGQFSLVVSNPPYFTPGRGQPSPDPQRQSARASGTCPPAALFEAAAWLLPTGGKFCMVYRPERLTDLLWEARNHKLEPKRLRFVRHRTDSEASLVLLECRKGGGPGLKFDPDLVLYGPDGAPTPQTREIYHLL